MEKLTPSKTKIIHFPDGKSLPLNRRERRQNKLYNRDLVPMPEKK